MKGNCPVCNQPLENGTDIVVCPICGTPHHRSCYQHNGGCFYENLHDSGFVYTNHESTQETSQNSTDTFPTLCPMCKAENDRNAIFCSSCGAPLHMAPRTGFSQNSSAGPTYPNFAGENPFRYTQQAPVYDETDTIDQIKTKDLADFVGNNQVYYINYFRKFSTQKSKISFNFPAFFCPSVFFLYRKMWLMSAVSILLTISSLLPILFEAFLMEGMSVPIISALFTTVEEAIQFQYTVSLISSILSLGFGLFANYLYFLKAKRTVQKAYSRANTNPGLSQSTISASIKAKGGICTTSVTVFLCALFLSVTVLLFFLT